MSVAIDDLVALEAVMTHAFATGDASGLEVLGYGEISTVVVCASRGRRYACKRLPPLPTERDADAYATVFGEYRAALESAGIRVVDSTLERVPSADGGVVVYCVQPVLPAEQLAVRVLAQSDEAAGLALFEKVLDRILGAVSPRLGVDGQLSNWMVQGDELLFLDVTTPLLKDEAGRDRLDTELFLAAVPSVVRPLFRRFVVRDVIDKYHDPRGVVLDLVANLVKEGQRPRIAAFLRAANGRLDRPIDEAEVEAYYASDARVWTLWQAMRRLDRTLRTRVLGKPYPFLLPGTIERRG